MWYFHYRCGHFNDTIYIYYHCPQAKCVRNKPCEIGWCGVSKAIENECFSCAHRRLNPWSHMQPHIYAPATSPERFVISELPRHDNIQIIELSQPRRFERTPRRKN